MKKLLITLMVFVQLQQVFAQSKVNVSYEDIKQQCKDVPFDQRLRVKVARFSVNTDAPHELQDNLAIMLTSALQQVNCYTVLQSLQTARDTRNEVDNGSSAYTKKSSAPRKGRELGAQYIVTGSITKFSVKKSGFGVALVSVGSNKVKIGFTLQIVSPETGVVVYSHDVDVEGKASGGTTVGMFGANLVSSTTQDPAVSNACQQGIIASVEYMASIKDLLKQPQADPANAENDTEITLSHADFSSFTDLASILSGIPGYKSMEKSLSGGTATYTVTHTGSDDDLLSAINTKIGKKYKVVGFGDGKIQLSK